MFLRLLWFPACIFLLPAFAISQNTEWKLAKDQNGIKVFTRHAEGFAIDELKAELIVKAPLNAVVAVIMDADHYKEWIYSCAEARVFQRVNDSEQYQYLVNDLPYPFSDRDIAVHFKIWQDYTTKKVFTSSIAEPDAIPAVSGKVRLRVYVAGYELTPLPGGDVRISYQLKLDPGGSIPDWMVNLFIVKGPYESTFKMRERLETGNYNEAKVDFLD